jgi:PAS domain S-box-containing protein
MAVAAGQSSPTPADRRPGRGWRLRTYLVALVVLFVLTAGTGVLYGWAQAERDATLAAAGDAEFGAGLAAAGLGTNVATLRATVAQLAASPQIQHVFDNPAGCSLAFDTADGPDAGHLDLVRPDGSVACSSRTVTGADREVYRAADWLAGALWTPAVTAPVRDARTGHASVLATADVAGAGFVAGFVSLERLGTSLRTHYGGPRSLEFLITTDDGGVVLTRSIDPARWIGVPVATTAFTTVGTVGTVGAVGTVGTVGAGDRTDVAGARRLYGQASVPSTGWRVYAGADHAEALASVRRSFQRVCGAVGIGLMIALAATFIVSRRINGLLNAVDRELVERRHAEAAAREHEHNYRQLFDANPYPMVVLDAGTLALLEANDAALTHYGYRREDLLTLALTDLCPPEDATALADAMAAAGTADRTGPIRQHTSNGDMIEVRLTSQALCFAGREVRCVIIDDVTAKEQLARRLRQSERLESLGQLAGGVAHDFNNLLGVIFGFASMAATEVESAAQGDPRWQPVHQDLTQALAAVDRSTALTRQLLAFARTELAQPRVFDLNAVIVELEQFLRRSLGEDIELRTRLARDLLPVYADPGQIERVLVNLAVNARDAMPTGGALAITTDNFTVDDEYAERHLCARLGDHVRLRVSDTGVGMSQDTIDRAFEPFFTTKPIGEGTGLGLATIYGIVTDAGGSVQIASEPGVGTTITALLPPTQRARTVDVPPDLILEPGRGETILIVEDEADLRTLTEGILRRNNYQVLTALDGPQAIRLAESRQRIDLLLTDVVMPYMLGHVLAQHLQATRPELPVIYLSGYAEPILTTHKTLPPDATLLTRPITQPMLLSAVRHALDARPAAGDRRQRQSVERVP